MDFLECQEGRDLEVKLVRKESQAFQFLVLGVLMELMEWTVFQVERVSLVLRDFLVCQVIQQKGPLVLLERKATKVLKALMVSQDVMEDLVNLDQKVSFFYVC